MNALWDDVRLALRALLRSPSYALAALSTLGLALGGVTAVFSLLYAVVLEPMPFPAPDELVVVEEKFTAHSSLLHIPVSPRELMEIRERLTAVKHVSGFVSASANLTRDGSAERVAAAYVTPDVFKVFQTPAAFGRVFDETDGAHTAPSNVVVLGAAFHRRVFGGDPSIVGTTLELDGRTHKVLGVLPEAYDHAVRDRQEAHPLDVWVPLTFTPEQLDATSRGGRYVRAFARLAPGRTLAQARDEAHRLGATFVTEHPTSYAGGFGMEIRPMRAYFAEDGEPVLNLLFGAVLLVLLAACANVASLTIARMSARRQELAARVALGASAGRLSAHVLVESGVLALGGGLLGLVIGRAAIDGLLSLHPKAIVFADEAGLDGPVVLVVFAATAVAALLTGLGPALHAARTPPGEVLRDGARSSSGRSTMALRAALVVAQVALSLALMSSTWTMLRSLAAFSSTPPGFNPNGVTVATVSLDDTTYNKKEEQRRFAATFLDQLASAPGLDAFGFTSVLPLTSWSDFSFRIEGQPADEAGVKAIAQTRFIGGDYFQAMEIPLRAGRVFTPGDGDGAPMVAIVSEGLARKHIDGDPVGKRLVMTLGVKRSEVPITIVGVVGDTRDMGLDEPIQSFIYLPFAQTPQQNLGFVVKSASPASAVAALRAASASTDLRQPLANVGPLEAVVHESLARRRFALLLFSVFAVLGLGLSVLGVYGITAYAVAQRTQELGVRLALGADEGALVRLVVAGTLRIIGIGVILGAVLAAGLGRALASAVILVEPWDPGGTLTLGLLLLVAGAIASYLPARRIARLELGHALRAE